jgi:transcriptional regulator with XRE-family HTH domain
LRLRRLAKGLSQQSLAERARLSKSTVERIEDSEDGVGIKLDHLVTLALVLECELLDVIDSEWLVRSPGDFSGAPPERTTLERRAGGPDPPEQRERAPRRPRTG